MGHFHNTQRTSRRREMERANGERERRRGSEFTAGWTRSLIPGEAFAHCRTKRSHSKSEHACTAADRTRSAWRRNTSLTERDGKVAYAQPDARVNSPTHTGAVKSADNVQSRWVMFSLPVKVHFTGREQRFSPFSFFVFFPL